VHDRGVTDTCLYNVKLITCFIFETRAYPGICYKETNRGLGDGNPPAESRGRATVENWGQSPQKVETACKLRKYAFMNTT